MFAFQVYFVCSVQDYFVYWVRGFLFFAVYNSIVSAFLLKCLGKLLLKVLSLMGHRRFLYSSDRSYPRVLFIYFFVHLRVSAHLLCSKKDKAGRE